MTRDELPVDKQKEFDSIMAACKKDLEENTPKPRATFDSQVGIAMRKIAEKYMPRLRQLLEDSV